MATPAQVKTFINMMAPLAVAMCNKKTKKVLPSVCVAQACCESAYGTSPKMIKAKAVFGIKVGTSKVRFGTAWKGTSYDTETKECYDSKTLVPINDFFRAYDTVQDATEDYYDLLAGCSRYAKCIGEMDYVKSITAIKNGGYATSPTYISTITSIIKTYNLTQYDGCMTGGATSKKNPYKEPTVNIRKGSSGEDVKWLQWELCQRGYTLAVDGVFGAKTLEAVRAFQADNGLKVDGVVGPVTRQALKE